MIVFRGMKEDPATRRPKTGYSPRTLGVRFKQEAVDINVGECGKVKPGTGGMSVNSEHYREIPPYRRPPEFDGRGKDALWWIDTRGLPVGLAYRPDPNPESGETHGLIEPSRTMHFHLYLALLHGTRYTWARARREIIDRRLG